MSSFPNIPQNLSLGGRWAVSVNDVPLSATDRSLQSSLEAVVVSRETEAGYELHRVILQPLGTSGAPETSENQMLVEVDKSNWSSPYIPQLNNSPMEPSSVYQALNKTVARNLLSGHLIAIRYNTFIKVLEIEGHVDFAARWDREFKFSLGHGQDSLTKFTAMSYKALTEWNETSPARVLAAVEGVAVTTIRNRIYAARELGEIEKPGSGVRSARKNQSQ
jgi:hypothetical protein